SFCLENLFPRHLLSQQLGILLGGLALPLFASGVAFRRQREPFMRLNEILRSSAAVAVHDSEIFLCVRIALRGGEAIPFERLGIVALDAFALGIHEAEIAFAVDVASIRG